jgi:hypothetical protein
MNTLKKGFTNGVKRLCLLAAFTAIVAGGVFAQTNYSGTYQILTNRGMALDIEGTDKTRDGLRVVTNTSQRNAQSQQWRIARQSDGDYTITNVLSGKLMDVSGGSTANGVEVIQYPANRPVSKNQLWRITAVGGEVKITSVNSGRVLDVSGNNAAPNTRMIQWQDQNSANQRFKLEPINTTAGSSTSGSSGGSSSSSASSTTSSGIPATTGELIVTGLEKHNGKYIFSPAMMIGSNTVLLAADNCSGTRTRDDLKFFPARISNGRAVLKVWNVTGDYNLMSYNGNHNVSGSFLYVYDTPVVTATTIDSAIDGGIFTNLRFTNGKGTVVFVPYN